MDADPQLLDKVENLILKQFSLFNQGVFFSSNIALVLKTTESSVEMALGLLTDKGLLAAEKTLRCINGHPLHRGPVSATPTPALVECPYNDCDHNECDEEDRAPVVQLLWTLTDFGRRTLTARVEREKRDLKPAEEDFVAGILAQCNTQTLTKLIDQLKAAVVEREKNHEG